VTASVTDDEEALARSVLPPSAWPLFDGMPVADRRHGLDVAERLRADGWSDPDLLAAALLHDAAKGHRLRLWHRVGGVLLETLAPRLLRRLASSEPASWRYPWHLYLHHAELSAQAALEAGCSPRTASFIRGTPAPDDRAADRALQLADEAA
jgi:hypothetical protein